MVNSEAVVEGHYSHGRVKSVILEALTATGKSFDDLAPVDLAACDSFHSRGRAATLELAERIPLRPGLRVLDVGCGVGGTARFLASEHECEVTGIDLTREYVETATELTRLVGLEGRVSFHRGSALDLPYAAGSFDLVWTEHVQMNVADKVRFYEEIARVLVPGGTLAFHDIFRGPGAEPVYPVPWAEESSFSWLATESAAKSAIAGSLKLESWVDCTAEALEWAEGTMSRIADHGPPPLGLHLLMGNTAPGKLRNYVKNARDGRIVVVQGVATR